MYVSMYSISMYVQYICAVCMYYVNMILILYVCMYIQYVCMYIQYVCMYIQYVCMCMCVCMYIMYVCMLAIIHYLLIKSKFI